MKFDATTIQILKNFSSINPSIQFKKGSRLATISSNKTVLARANLTQEVPSDFAIYDLPRLLGIISMFENPDIGIKEKYMNISQGDAGFQYSFTDVSLIVTPPSKDINLGDADVSFSLKKDDLKKTLRALNVASLPHIAVSGSGGKIYLQAFDAVGASNDVFAVEVGTTTATFRMVFSADNIKMIDDDYDVSISSKGLGYFKGTIAEYWIAVESKYSNFTA
jgi:hypothetical protein